MAVDENALEAAADRFWSKVSIGDQTQCWEWTAYRSAAGYGIFNVSRKTMRAHRIAYELSCGPIAPGMVVCHHCDNPPCCNPSHLFVGTIADNNLDKTAKGRNVRPVRDETAVNYSCGERSNLSKLSEEIVRDIRRRRASGERTTILAKEYGVDRTLIWQIAERKVWKHVQ